MEKLVGYKKFTSKNGKEFCVANVIGEYTQKEKERGCFGQKVSEIFLPENQTNLFVPSDIGKGIEVEYEIVGSRAYIASVSVVGK